MTDSKQLSEKTRRRLEIQGMTGVDKELAEVVPWNRLPYALCAILASIGTLTASPVFLWGLVPMAALAAASPVHPFDLIYNHGIRHLRGTGPMPLRGAPVRFACGMGAVCLVVTALAFQSGAQVAGYILGGMIMASAGLVGTTDICIPSMIFGMLFGSPRAARSTGV